MQQLGAVNIDTCELYPNNVWSDISNCYEEKKTDETGFFINFYQRKLLKMKYVVVVNFQKKDLS